MASTFLRPDSKFIWLRFKNDAGKWQSKATKYRKDNAGDRRQAELLARDMGDEERLRRSAEKSEHWECWVDAWMVGRYKGKTLNLYQIHWRKLLAWLVAEGIRAPMQLSYRAAMDYQAKRLKEGGSNNLTIMELKFLSSVMNEAVRREMVNANPLVRMGLKKEKAKEKQPWSDDAIHLVAARIAKKPVWMRVTFLLGLYQAARLRQCEIPLADIDLERKRITYWKRLDGKPLVKGDKPFTQPLDERLVQPLAKIVAERRNGGHAALCEIPRFPSLLWRRFLDSLKLTTLSHHGLRVTWITRAATSGKDGQRGIHLSEAKRFVNHGSSSVHAIYQRMNADDISHVPAAMNLPALPSH
jgi:hypothetical protein